MKFLIFNFVTGGALVYLVLAGGPPSVAIEGSQPVRTVSATAASDPGQQGGAGGSAAGTGPAAHRLGC